MRKATLFVSIFVILFLLLVIFGYFRTVLTPSGAKLTFLPASYDFGKVKYGEVAKYTFTLKNEGGSKLEIAKVSTSCGCTTARVLKTEIAPYETTQMEVSFDPAVHKDDSDLGKVTRVVYIASNDSQNPEAEVKIFADVHK